MAGSEQRRTLWSWVAVAVCTLLISLYFLWSYVHSPRRALDAFYSGPERGFAEDMNMDPLILAGDEVVPIVIEEVRRRDMPLRRYAIGFLGNGSYRDALPVLKEILTDPTEVEYFRADALEAIYKIDRLQGMDLARSYLKEEGYLGRMAGYVLKETDFVKQRRTLADAITGRHD